MSTYNRPTTSYTPTTTSANINKYANDSGSSVAVSSLKVDADINYVIDALNTLVLGAYPTVSGKALLPLRVNSGATGVEWSQLGTTAIADKAISVAKIADGTDGQLITWDANGVAATVATGNAGQVLTSNGTGTAPTFSAPMTGANLLIATRDTDQTSGTIILYATEVVDVANAYNTSTGEYTVPSGQGGYYHVTASFRLTSGANINAGIQVNGVAVIQYTGVGTPTDYLISGTVAATAGQVIRIGLLGNITGDSTRNRLQIMRVA